MSSIPDAAQASPFTEGVEDTLRRALAALSDKAKQENLEEPQQQLLGKLINLGERISDVRDGAAKTSLAEQFDRAASLVSEKEPNMLVVQELFEELQVRYNWQRSLAMRLMWDLGQGKPIVPAIVGTLVAALIVLGVATTIFICWDYLQLEETVQRRDLGILLFAAVTGSIVSQYQALFSPPASFYDPGTIYTRSILKVVIAVVFALAVLAVLMTGVVDVAGLSLSNTGETGQRGPAVMFLIGFLSGFSEKFAPGIFEKLPS